MYSNIPNELKKINNWVCFNNKKVPINPNTGQYAESNNSSTWGEYSQAVDKAKECNFGIGFMLGGTDYVGIDIDDLDKDNNKKIAREFTDKLNSYTEYSPSGNGIHIWIKGEVELKKYRKGSVEMYDRTSPRYLTFTGKQIGECKEIKTNVTDKLMELYKKYIDNKPKKDNVIKMPSQNLDLSESEIIDLIRDSKNGNKFDDLYNGDWENMYNSQSEADLALSNILAFWTGRDFNKMDTIFRNSGLMREKWEEKRADGTYGSIILSKAINDTTDVYKPKDSYNVILKQEPNITSQFGSKSVQAIGRAYHKQTQEGPAMISTFIMELKEVIKDDLDKELYYKVNFVSKDYNEELIFKAKEMNNKNNFMDLLQHPSLSFTGSLNDLQEIKKILANQEYRNLRGVSYIGFHKSKGERVFVTQNQAIDKDFNQIEDITINQDNQIITTKILEEDPITKEELEMLSKHLFKFNDLSITSSLISMLPIFMMKPLLFDKDIKTQHLVMYGEAGSGKSQTAESIILPFYSLNAQEVLSCSNVTQFSLLKSLSNTNSLPVILEEYKPSFLAESQVRMISDNLRNTYDCHIATRGTKNQKLINYPMIAPIVLIGEEGQEETAIKERSIILSFNKKGREGKEESFMYLKNNPQLMQKLGRSILNLILKADKNKMVSKRNELMENFISKQVTENRVRESVGNLLLGLNYIIGVYKELDLNFEKEVGMKTIDIVNSINKNIFIEVLDESKNTKSVVDNTIEQFASMAGLNALGYNQDYTVTDNELAFRMPSVYPKFTKFMREYDIKEELLTSRNQFTKQLKNTDYFIKDKAVRYDGIPKWSFVLDLRILKERGLDIQPFLDNKERV